MEDEKQLVNALQNGSEKAFETLVAIYQENVLNTCLRFVPNLHDAEDLAQEVFLTVYRSIGSFRGEAALSTWIYRLAITASLEAIRYRKRKKRIAFFQSLTHIEGSEALDVHSNFGHPGILLENQERARVLYQHIDKLPDNQRIAFTLHKVDGLSHKEICEIMDTSISAVESLLFRANRNLKKSLKIYYEKQMI